MLSPGSSQDSPSWLWGTVCTGTPQHVESEGWKDAPVTLKDIPSTSNPHPNLETPVFLLTALRVSSLALQQDAQESGPQDTHSVLPSQGTVLRHPKRGAAHSCPVSPCTRCSPLLCQPSRQPDAPRSLSLTLRLLSSVQPGFLQAG